METWVPVAGFEGLYQVSDLGQVWSEPRWSGGHTQGRRYRQGRILQRLYSPKGYPKVALSREGQQSQVAVHTLVLTAFRGPPPAGMEACHNDGIPENCAVSNLRWDTHGNNLRDRARHGTDPHASRTHCPRGHEYRPGNLREWQWSPAAPANRQCLACSKAHNRLCRGNGCDHSSAEFVSAADWYYRNPGRRWRQHVGATGGGVAESEM